MLQGKSPPNVPCLPQTPKPVTLQTFKIICQISLKLPKKVVLVTQLCPTLFDPHGLQPTRLLCSWDFPDMDTGVVCQFLLQGIFLTQGLNPGFLHYKEDSLPPEQPWKPVYFILALNLETTLTQITQPSSIGNKTPPKTTAMLSPSCILTFLVKYLSMPQAFHCLVLVKCLALTPDT